MWWPPQKSSSFLSDLYQFAADCFFQAFIWKMKKNPRFCWRKENKGQVFSVENLKLLSNLEAYCWTHSDVILSDRHLLPPPSCKSLQNSYKRRHLNFCKSEWDDFYNHGNQAWRSPWNPFEIQQETQQKTPGATELSDTLDFVLEPVLRMRSPALHPYALVSCAAH